jgi:hypothetical protein
LDSHQQAAGLIRLAPRAALGGALLALYAAALVKAASALTVDHLDGFLLLSNALHLAGRAGFAFEATRPPLGAILLAPLAGAAFRAGGAAAALTVCHAAAALIPALLAALSWKLYREDLSRSSAALCAVLLAVDPLLLRYAPFLLLDHAAALAAIFFLWRGWRFLLAPGAVSFALMLAAYGLAVSLRYYLFILFLVPLAHALLRAPGDRRRRARAALPAALLPALVYPLLVLALGATLKFGDGFGWEQSFAAAAQALKGLVALNTTGKSPVSPLIYAASLWGQLGPAALTLAAAGIWVRLRRGERDAYLALSVAAPLAALSFGIANREQRFLLAFLPGIFWAVGAGVDHARAKLGVRFASALLVGAAVASVYPWPRVGAAWDFLLHEPALRTEAPAQLGRALEAGSADGCAAWRGGPVLFRQRPSALERDEQAVQLDWFMMPFYSSRRVVPEGSGGCRAAWLVEVLPEQSIDYDPDRILARVLDSSGKLRWEVMPDGLRQTPQS